MNIPFFKPSINDDDIIAVITALKSGWLTRGVVSKELEADLCKFTGAKYAVSVSSCTAALHLACLAVGVKPGDEVVVPAYTFVATAHGPMYCGAKPIFVDVDYDYNISVKELAKVNYRKVRAVICVDFAGLPCDYRSIRKVVPSGIPIIADAAHSITATYSREYVGNIPEADITCFSFYATKCITTGDGGACITNNNKLHEFIQCASLHGLSRDAWKRYDATAGARSWEYDIITHGYKYNLPDLLAALGRTQLARAHILRLKRKAIAEYYDTGFMDGNVDLKIPELGEGKTSSYHLYIIQVDKRDEVVAKLAEKGVKTSVHCIPVPTFTAFGKQDINQWPVSKNLFQSSISLPIYPDMTADEQAYVVRVVKEAVR